MFGMALPAGTNRVIADQFGSPITPPLVVNSNAAGDVGLDRAPQIATDGAGHWVALWHSNDALGSPTGNDNDVFLSRSDDWGATWSRILPLNTNAYGDGVSADKFPKIITDGLGHWIAAWESNDNLGGTVGNDVDIFISRSADNGVTWTDSAALNANAGIDGGNDFDICITTDAKGLWVAAWRTLDSLGGVIGADGDILTARSNDNGVSWTDPVPLNTNAALDTGHDFKPGLAADGNGNWICVWHSSDTLGGTIGSDLDILYARSIDNAVTWSAPLPLNSNAAIDTNKDDLDARITTDGLGNWVVVWTSQGSLGTLGADRDILVSRSADAGLTWSPAAPLNTNAAADAGQDQSPQITTDRQGNWVAIWSSSENLGGSIGSDFDILIARSVDNGATWTPPAVFNTNAVADSGLDDVPQLAMDAQGSWLAVWETHDSLGATIGTEGDIVSARFALPDCNLNLIPDVGEVDCNSNGVPDDCDIASGASLDVNGDGIPDECQPPPPPSCIADIAPPGGNGLVNVDDLLLIINSWGTCVGNCPADIAPPGPPHGNGVVNVDDLLAIINAWGPCP